MAVQAQYPSNIILFNRNVQEGPPKPTLLPPTTNHHDYSQPQPQPQPQPPVGVAGAGCGRGATFLDHHHRQSPMFFPNTTSNNNNNNVGGAVNNNPSRKRTREIPTSTTTTTTTAAAAGPPPPPPPPNLNFCPQNHHQLIDTSPLVSTGLNLSYYAQHQHQNQHQHQHQHQQSSILSQHDFNLHLKQYTHDLHYFLLSQGEQLKRTLAEKRERHYRMLLTTADEAASRLMKAKETEVESAVRRNVELVTRASQLTAEAQAWQAKAQTHEAQAASLQAQIHQAINGGVTDREAAVSTGQKGGGGGEAEDSESAYIDPVSEKRVKSRSCKVCSARAASVVLLPCRHLCVCTECNGVVQACPVCLSFRSASVEVYLS